MNYRSAQSYLESISGRGMKPGLERMGVLMERFGHPERRFRAVHVAGTNGKGSVCAMLESIFRNARIRTALYTSPHLLDVRERITVGGRRIGKNDFSRGLKEVMDCAGPLKEEMTYFELVTALAFLYFARAKVELAVVEVGMGGRLDATNVLPGPDLCIITNIALDHTDSLGTTLSEIASEKAGILKKQSICLTGATASSLKVIRKACSRLRVRCALPSAVLPMPREVCSLRGEYQIKNMGIVLKAVEILRGKKWRISENAVRMGLKNVLWPGRFEMLSLRVSDRDVPVLLDGAHNPAATAVLASSLKREGLIKKKCLLIFHALRDKDALSMARSLLARLKPVGVLIPALHASRASEPSALQKIFKKAMPGVKTFSLKSVAECLERIPMDAKWVLVTGSLYLIGETCKSLKIRSVYAPDILKN